MPQPRISLGLALRDVATSCLDISDGLLADLGHILKASKVGADIHLPNIPTSKFISSNLSKVEFQQYVLTGGDDYELCFTASPNDEAYLHRLSKNLNLALSKVGKITSSPGLNVFDNNNQIIELSSAGYNHFN
jgi:thiamine-monophosphate kinase